MTRLFEDNKVMDRTLAQTFEGFAENTLVNPTIIGGTFQNAAYKSSDSGARLEIFPEGSKTIGMIVYAGDATEVFKVLVAGTDVGDVIMGDYAGGAGAKWDDSASTFSIKGTFFCKSFCLYCLLLSCWPALIIRE